MKRAFQAGWRTGTCYRGEALAMLGQVQEGIAQMREGMAASQSIGERCYLPGTLGSLAEAQAKAGHARGRTDHPGRGTRPGGRDGRALLGSRALPRCRAELLLAKRCGDDAEAEASLQQGHRGCPPPAGQVVGAAGCDQPGASVAEAGQDRRGARAAGADLRLVHRGVRHTRSERGPDATGRIIANAR